MMIDPQQLTDLTAAVEALTTATNTQTAAIAALPAALAQVLADENDFARAANG